MIKQNIEKFTESQEECLPKLEAFLKSKITDDLSTRVFLLTGKAGTGKTTIIKYALQKDLKEDLKLANKHNISFDLYSMPNVLGVALSHKAKNVLSNSIHVCKTFASTFGLEQTYGENGEIKFEKKKSGGFKVPPCELPLRVFVHDECSMYDKEMLKFVLSDTNLKSKIVFMGDAGQLPPITSEGDKDSPVFELKLPDSNKHELKERVRQTEGNPILELSDIIYNEIFGSENLELVLNAFKDDKLINGRGHRVIRYQDFLPDFKNSSENYQDTKVIAYRNARVNDFNLSIRNYIHNKPDKQFIPGEIIYMNDTFVNDLNSKKMSNMFNCYNSDEYLLNDVTTKEVEGIKCDLLIIDKTGHKHLIDYDQVAIPVVCKSETPMYNKRRSTLAHYAKTAELYMRSKKWAQFYNFSNNFANVSYGYCYTGHKIQGSGYKNIYIDVNDIVTVGPISNKRKLQALYTAVTRATDLVTFLKA